MAVTKTGLVTPAQSLNPQVEQIYPIVNALFEQMTGRDDIQAVDTASLVSMGQRIINEGKLDLWFNTLARRIGLTLDGYRVYKNKFSDLYRSQIEWGAFVQKITAEMPEATEDKTYDIGYMNGKSVDHYVINNPKVHQRIFDKETPYSFFITTSTKLLRDAFLGASPMQGLLSQVTGKVRNKIEIVLEELARIAVANFILNLDANRQEVHLLSMYNSLTGESLTPATSRFSVSYLRYAVGVMNTVSDNLEVNSIIYNKDKFDRFTPKENQRFYVLSQFLTAIDTVSVPEAYNPKGIVANANIKIPYWQGSGREMDLMDWENISKISGTVGEGNAKKQVEKKNLIALLFDWEAIGTFRQEEEVLTTPVNARARYYNTFWHEGQLWFNDMSENGIAFYND